MIAGLMLEKSKKNIGKGHLMNIKNIGKGHLMNIKNIGKGHLMLRILAPYSRQKRRRLRQPLYCLYLRI